MEKTELHKLLENQLKMNQILIEALKVIDTRLLTLEKSAGIKTDFTIPSIELVLETR